MAADGAKPLGVNALWHAAPNATVAVLSATGHLWARIETCSHGHHGKDVKCHGLKQGLD
eukprot:SAG22_NODE_21614_length_255_cov_1.314103_1_plen_58_part_10